MKVRRLAHVVGRRMTARAGLGLIAIAVLGSSSGCSASGARWDRGRSTGRGGASGGGAGAFSGSGGGPVGGSEGAERDAAADTGGGSGGAAGSGPPGPALGWRDLSPCIFPKPTPIYDYAPMLAFDSDRRKLVFYGGSSRSDAELPPEITPDGPATNLWELDADSGAWTDRTLCPPVDFVALNGAMVYDTRRRRLVIFTGVNGNVGEFDPATSQWTDRPFPFDGTPFPAGPPLAAVYDEARGKAIVFIDFDPFFGGIEAWEWDPSGRWSARATRDDLHAFPDASYMPAIAYDADRGALWLFGVGGDGYFDHLWRWDVGVPDAGLIDVTPSVRPAAWPRERLSPGLAYDPARRRLVLYGGAAATYLRDLWEWDPDTSTWLDRTPANLPVNGTDAPPGIVWPVAGHDASRIFADAAGGQVLRYTWGSNDPRWAWNGATGTWSVVAPAEPPRWPDSSPMAPAWNTDDGTLLAWMGADVWRWSPQTEAWQLLTAAAVAAVPRADRDPTVWPRSRVDSAAAYDRGAKRLVIFGGTTGYELLDDVWLFDPATRQISRVPRPSGAGWPAARSGHALAYDPARGRVLLFGGSAPDARADLWAFDTGAQSWQDLTPPAAGTWPPPRAGHALLLDDDRGLVVLTGGTAGDAPMTDVWEMALGGSTWSRIADTSPAGHRPAPGAHDPIVFAPGLGIFMIATRAFTATPQLWWWSPDARAWTGENLGLPRHEAAFYSMSLAGLDHGLLFLYAGAALDRLQEDYLFWETWRASALP
jgi:hypothetical protein